MSTRKIQEKAKKTGTVQTRLVSTTKAVKQLNQAAKNDKYGLYDEEDREDINSINDDVYDAAQHTNNLVAHEHTGREYYDRYPFSSIYVDDDDDLDSDSDEFNNQFQVPSLEARRARDRLGSPQSPYAVNGAGPIVVGAPVQYPYGQQQQAQPPPKPVIASDGIYVYCLRKFELDANGAPNSYNYYYTSSASKRDAIVATINTCYNRDNVKLQYWFNNLTPVGKNRRQFTITVGASNYALTPADAYGRRNIIAADDGGLIWQHYTNYTVVIENIRNGFFVDTIRQGASI